MVQRGAACPEFHSSWTLLPRRSVRERPALGPGPGDLILLGESTEQRIGAVTTDELKANGLAIGCRWPGKTYAGQACGIGKGCVDRVPARAHRVPGD